MEATLNGDKVAIHIGKDAMEKLLLVVALEEKRSFVEKNLGKVRDEEDRLIIERDELKATVDIAYAQLAAALKQQFS